MITRQQRQRQDQRTTARDYRRLGSRRRKPYERENPRLNGIARIPRALADRRNYADVTGWIDY